MLGSGVLGCVPLSLRGQWRWAGSADVSAASSHCETRPFSCRLAASCLDCGELTVILFLSLPPSSSLSSSSFSGFFPETVKRVTCGSARLTLLQYPRGEGWG